MTAAGLLPPAALAVMEAGLGRSLIHGYEQLVFLGVLATGIVFEGVWYVGKGTNSCGGSPERGGVGRSKARSGEFAESTRAGSGEGPRLPPSSRWVDSVPEYRV